MDRPDATRGPFAEWRRRFPHILAPGTLDTARSGAARLYRPFADVLALLDRARTAVAVGLTGLAALGWFLSVDDFDPSRISDVGLITALPVAMIAAPIVLSAGFIVALNGRPLRRPLLVLDVVLLILMLHGLTSFIQEVPRFSTSYVHAGFGEAIMRTGDLFVERDARFSWPLFFVLGAYLTSIAGFDNPIDLAYWIPALSNLLYVVPLALILRAFTADHRLIWLGLWVFVIGNWVGQDYYSPQGFNILLYLTVIAILLTWFRAEEPVPLAGVAISVRTLVRSRHADGPAEPAREPVPPISAGARVGLVLILVLLAGVVVASHQLTPFALVAATTILVLTRQTVLRGYPVLVALLLGSWLSYMTLAFLSGHIESLLSEALQTEAVATAAIGDRLRGNPGHLFIVSERIFFSAAFWAVAFVGGLRRFWNGHWDLPLGLLAAFPFGFLALQSYGGEVLLRVYLFALPFMAFFVAGLFYPRLQSVSKLQPLLLFGLMSLLVVGFLYARYGNDRADAFTADEVAAVDRADSLMPTGSVVVTANHNSPIGYRDYDRLERFVGANFATFTVDQIARAMRRAAEGRPAFVFLSESQRNFYDLYGFPGEAWDELLRELKSSASFDVVFETRDAILFQLENEATASP